MTRERPSSSEELVQRDRRHLWHPYTQHGIEADPLPILRAEGAFLYLTDGRRLIDGISSWWSILHGHGHPVLIEAMQEQARELDHVLFAGATHQPAVALAEELLDVAPGKLSRVFYSDNGSTAVEVALKMVLHSWIHASEPQRRVFIALEGSYHGDTFGAMSVGDPDPFFDPYRPFLFEAKRIRPDDEALDAALDELGDRAAGVIVEPLVQGAAGMRIHPASFLRHLRARCDQRDLPLIADEVMTGFGRTGSLFACQRAEIAPDLLCIAKGLTGGVLPLAATLTTERMFEAFLHDRRSRFFPHGHTWTANPIGCAVARASLRLTLENDVPRRLEEIGQRLHRTLETAGDHVDELRHIGGICALDLHTPPEDQAGYLSELAPRIRRNAIEKGVLLRPLGNVLYAIPPACIEDGDVDRLAETMLALIPKT